VFGGALKMFFLLQLFIVRLIGYAIISLCCCSAMIFALSFDGFSVPGRCICVPPPARTAWMVLALCLAVGGVRAGNFASASSSCRCIKFCEQLR
jgi:hypothetical protein